jgi:hypothetical protein
LEAIVVVGWQRVGLVVGEFVVWRRLLCVVDAYFAISFNESVDDVGAPPRVGLEGGGQVIVLFQLRNTNRSR